ncbi:hypothetical protein D3C71_1342540 [compost metagenome]
MCRQFFHIPYAQPGIHEYALDSHKRKIREVLMVYRIKLVLFDKTHQVWKLKRYSSTRFKGCLKSPSEIVYIRNMGIYIIATNQVCSLCFVD